MITDLTRFVETERPYWEELEALLGRQERDLAARMGIEEVLRFHYLYERVSSGLARLPPIPANRETRRYLETLVGRAYAEIHETRARPHRFRPLHWFLRTFPATVRRHAGPLRLTVAVTLAGCLFGALAIALDPASKEVLMPFDHLLGSPEQRVAEEEQAVEDYLAGSKAQGAAWYFQHNTTVSINVMALGATWGVGTLILLLMNGVMLGAVAMDYILAGQARFLVGWLLPHGSVEIPAILLAGQAGLVLAAALIGWGSRMALRERLRRVGPDLVTMIGGVAVMLAWAGVVESFLSQYHEPTIPYAMKIAFGAVELVLLGLWLALGGRQRPTDGSAGVLALPGGSEAAAGTERPGRARPQAEPPAPSPATHLAEPSAPEDRT